MIINYKNGGNYKNVCTFPPHQFVAVKLQNYLTNKDAKDKIPDESGDGDAWISLCGSGMSFYPRVREK